MQPLIPLPSHQTHKHTPIPSERDVRTWFINFFIYNLFIWVISDSNITCTGEQHVTNATQGVIKNLAYPSTDKVDCAVRVKVPDDAYINVIIHDMERLASSDECDGGLRLRTSRICNFDETFPRKTLCSFSGNMTVFQACGDVDINMTPSQEGFRFYISFIGW